MLRVLAGLIACLLPAVAFAQDVGAPRLHVLDNGLRVLVVEDRTSPLVTVTWSAHVGDSSEPLDFAGNSHYLEHLLLFRGTDKYPGNQIGEWTAGRGGYLNGHTWYDYTAFEIMCAPADLEEALDRHEQMMFHGAFSGEDFETEKKAVFEELRSGLDRPYGYLWQTAPYHMYPGETFYSRSTIGTIEAVQAATVQRVRDYYRDYYVPNNMTLCIVGDVDTEAVLERVRARFSKHEPGDVPDALYEPLAMKPGITVVTEERDIGKAYFLLGLEGPDAASPDYFPFDVLAACLADGNTSLLREELVTNRELLDDVYVSAMPRRYPRGWQAITGEGEPQEAAAAVEELWKLLGRAAAGEFTDEDVELARGRLLSGYGVMCDDQLQVGMRLVESDAHGDYRLFSEYEDRLNRVTRADVRAVARKYLTADRFCLMAIFPTGQTPPDFAAEVRAGAERAQAVSGGVVSRALDSGATLLHEARPGAAVESFTLAVHAGDRDGDTAGVAEAVAEMMVRRTKERDKAALQEYLDRNGLRLNSWTTADAAFFSVQMPAGSTSKGAELLVEVLTQPDFAQEEWSAVREEMIASIDGAMDQPRSVAVDALTATVFAGTPYGRSFADVRQGLSGAAPGDLRDFWADRYRAGSMGIAYCGDAPVDAVADALSGLGTRKGRAPERSSIHPAAPSDVVRAARPLPGKTQANVYVAWPAPALDSDDAILWAIAEKAIGGDLAGRLWKLRQDEGLAYSVWLSGTSRRDHALTHVYIATAEAKREAALQAIDREVRRALDGLTADELDRVKVSYLANLNRLDRTASRRSGRLAQWWALGLEADRRTRLERVIATATLDDVNRVVRSVLDPEAYWFAEAGAVPPETDARGTN